jgi:hypothetical protein
VVILGLPVLLLPTTTVPAVVWIGLSLAYIATIVLAFRLKAARLKSVGIGGAFLAMGVTSVILSQLLASTQPIIDEQGKPLPGSIATLEKVVLGGSEQWITIRGKNVENPVLLYLGIGGPGAGGFPANFTSLAPLEEHFVVVNWDQPGTGKSYSAVPISTLTLERFVSDAHELTELLRARFGEDKIYVLGLSWGTILGTKLVQHTRSFFMPMLAPVRW